MPSNRITRQSAAAATARDQGQEEDDTHDLGVEAVEDEVEDDEGDGHNADTTDDSLEAGDKRKADDAINDESDHKGSKANEPDSKKPKQDTQPSNNTLNWLLSEQAFNLAFPTLPEGHGEIDWDPAIHHRKEPPAEDAGKHAADASCSSEKLLTYPDSTLTPFQNLVAALILSKPLSHRLGMRTINTLLNPPFGLRTVQDLDDAGFEGRRKVMWEARTQHKEKTASQLGDLVEGVKAVNGDDAEESLEGLQGLRKQLTGLDTEEAQQKVQSVLTDGIKGIGPTGTGIFLRRVQEQWEEVYPFADDRSLEIAREFGVVGNDHGVEELAEQLEGDRGKLVRVLDVLVGIQLEKKAEEGMRMAGVKK